MSKVAKSGIFGGIRLQADAIAAAEGDILSSAFFWRALRAEGVSHLVAVLLEGDRSLNADEIEHLFVSCSVPTILKLVSLVSTPVVSSSPLAVRLLSGVQYDDEEVPAGRNSAQLIAIQGEAGWWLRSEVMSQLPVVASRFPTGEIVGPRFEELARLCGAADLEGLEDRPEICSTLETFVQAGVRRFRATQSFEVARFLHSRGIPVTLTLCVDQYRSLSQLVRALVELSQLSLDGDTCFVWEVGIRAWRKSARQDPSLNLLLLRTMAIGSLLLAHLPVVRRASSRYFSKESLSLARHFGANELGAGAIDAFTSESLGFLPDSELAPLRISAGPFQQRESTNRVGAHRS